MPGIFVLVIGYSGCNLSLVLVMWFLAVMLITASYAGAMANIIDIAPNFAGSLFYQVVKYTKEHNMLILLFYYYKLMMRYKQKIGHDIV